MVESGASLARRKAASTADPPVAWVPDTRKISAGRGKLPTNTGFSARHVPRRIMKAYDTFGNAATERALKVILTNPQRK
jgi:hypothetical protein